MNPSPVLLVSDWDVAPEAVVDAARCRHPSAGVYLLVPARLRGLDWVGDPYASVPCARRQLDAIARLAARAGLNLVEASVGDPDPITAIGDALADSPTAAAGVRVSRPPRCPVPIRPLDPRAPAVRLARWPR